MPDYTIDLRRRGVEGRVVLEVDLDRRGRISDLRVRSSEDPELSEAALEAVRTWQFDSARRGFESTTYSFSADNDLLSGIETASSSFFIAEELIE